MKAKRIGKVESGQDIAIYGNFLFDFVAHGICLGECSVYDINSIETPDGSEAEPLCRFILDKMDVIIPHCNAACFGTEYYEDGDEFPLLYLNVYNNYHNDEIRYEGVCCVYRIWRDGYNFSSKLVQVIEIGFVNNTDLWKSAPDRFDRRPYGNFIIDTNSNKYYGFVMRDKFQTVRYFTFDLPKLSYGKIDDRFGVSTVVLNESDIIDYFDGEYGALQGACVKDGKIYSVTGFHKEPEIRIINPITKTQEFYADFLDYDIALEPEGIEFYNDTCYYVAGDGDTYILTFEE